VIGPRSICSKNSSYLCCKGIQHQWRSRIGQVHSFSHHMINFDDIHDDREFLQELKSLVLDTNPMVIANSIAALVEIQKGDCSNIVDRHSLGRVLSSLDACTECVRTLFHNCLI
jgi:hypothetical protein